MVHSGNWINPVTLPARDVSTCGMAIVVCCLLVATFTPLMPIVRHPCMGVCLIACGFTFAPRGDHAFWRIPLTERAAPTGLDLIFFVITRAHFPKLVALGTRDFLLRSTRPRQEDAYYEQSYEYGYALHDCPLLVGIHGLHDLALGLGHRSQQLELLLKLDQVCILMLVTGLAGVGDLRILDGFRR